MIYKNDLLKYEHNNSLDSFSHNIYFSNETDMNLSIARMKRSGLITENSFDEKRR